MNQLCKNGLVFALVLLVTTAPPLAIGQTPAPPAPPNIPLVEIPAGQEVTFPVDGARNGGRLLSFTSSNTHPLTVEIVDTASFTGLNLKCAAGREGMSAVTYTWRDAQGKEQTGTLVVACGEKIDKSITVTAAVGETARIEFPFVPETYSGLPVIGTLDAWVPTPFESGTNIRPSVEGTTVILFSLKAPDGTRLNWLVTVVGTPRRTSQVIIPNEGIRRAALQSNQCPGSSPYYAEGSGMGSLATYFQRAFPNQPVAGNVAGLGNVSFTSCQRPPTGDARQDQNLPPAYSAALASIDPSGEEAMQRALDGLVSIWRGRLPTLNPYQSVNNLGTRAVGAGGSVILPDGRRVPAIVYVAHLYNALFWVLAHGQGLAGTVPESVVLPVMQQFQKNVEAQARL